MKKMVLAMMAGVGLAATLCRADDPWAVARFGSTNSPLIYSGYIFIDGQYIDAPYQIQQHGYGIFVNGVFLHSPVNHDNVYPPAPPAAVTNEPGLPTDLVATNTVDDVDGNYTVGLTLTYLQDMDIYGTNALSIMTNLYYSLPCITQIVVRSQQPPVADIIDYYDRHGNVAHVFVPMVPRAQIWPIPPPMTDTQILSAVIGDWNSLQSNLARNESLWGNGYGITEYAPAPSSNIVQILRGTDPTNKLSQLLSSHTFDALDGNDTVTTAEKMLGHILTAFTASTQLEQRVSGDTSWTNNVPTDIPQPSP